MIRLVAMDLDGTLFNSKRQVDLMTQAVIRRYGKKRGDIRFLYRQDIQ